MRHRALLVAALAAVTPLTVVAQNASSPPKPPADTSESDDGGSSPLTYGVTGGSVGLNDGRTQTGASAVLRWHIGSGLALGITPSYAAVGASSSLGAASSSGLTDLPVELTYDHSFPGVLPTTFGAGFSVSLPVGDTASGFGSGSVGYGLSAGMSLQASEALSFHLGAGKPLTDYTLAGALGGSSGMWGDAEASEQLTSRVGVTLGLDGDLASSDSLGAARMIAGGLSVGLAGPLTLTVNGSHGISGPAARWQFSVGLGTDFAGLSSLGSSSPVQRAIGALGGRSHAASAPGHSGTTGSGNGRGKP